MNVEDVQCFVLPSGWRVGKRKHAICCLHEQDLSLSRRTFGAALLSIALASPLSTQANVGGKNRCDAAFDVRCGSDGMLLDGIKTYDPPVLSNAEVTDRVFMEFSAAGKEIGRVEFGLYRTLAPKSVDTFVRVCDGSFKGFSYSSSQVFRVERDMQIDLGRLSKGAKLKEIRSIDFTGRVRKKFVAAADEDTLNDEQNELKHNAAGLVSVPKGGGTFEFTITPSPNPSSDLDNQNVVIGQVLKGMDVVAVLNNLAVNQPTSYKGTFISMGKAINDKRAQAAEDDIYKPLQKTIIKSVGILR